MNAIKELQKIKEDTKGLCKQHHPISNMLEKEIDE